MKISGKTFPEAPVGLTKTLTEVFSEASNASRHQEVPVTPKVVTRTADTAKLMQAEKCGKSAIPLPAGDLPQISWVPFEDFSDSKVPDPVKLGKCADSLLQGAVPDKTSHDLMPTLPYMAATGIWQTRRKTTSTSGPNVLFDEAPGDARIAAEHRKNVGMYFTTPWASRLPLHQQQLEQGNYILQYTNGDIRRCTSYKAFMQFTGNGAHPLLPEVILHVAGPRLHNFLCQTYLYNQALSLFRQVGERRVEPMPELRTKFELEQQHDGRILAKYVASDENLSKAMLLGREPYDEYEASPMNRASIRFSGTLLFYPTLTFSIAPVQISATGLQFASVLASTASAATDTFA